MARRAQPTRQSRGSRLGRPNKGFDFTHHMRRLCDDLVTRLEPLNYIDLAKVALSFTQARKRVPYGIFATTTPMRFEDGELTGVRRGRKYGVQRLYNPQGVEMLYIISFYLPRFMDMGFREKLITIVHELWHISPDFNGDLRRHEGRCYAHTHSQKEYDAEMARMVDQWLDLCPPPEIYEFLHNSFDDLEEQFGGVFGIKIPHPKLIPLAS